MQVEVLVFTLLVFSLSTASFTKVIRVLFKHWRSSEVYFKSIISMCFDLGPVLRMCTRCLYTVINEACYWDEKVSLSEEAPDEIRFWSY